MSFYQNVFAHDFFADRHVYLNYEVPANWGRGDNIVSSWGVAPFNLNGNDSDSNSKNILRIGYAKDPEYKLWVYENYDVTTGAASSSSVKVWEVVSALNNNSSFALLFEAINVEDKYVRIRQKLPTTSMRFYIVNGRAESILLFNKKAGVQEMHSALEKHLIVNRYQKDSVGVLIKLDTSLNVDAAIINSATDKSGNSLGFNASSPTLDAALLRTAP